MEQALRILGFAVRDGELDPVLTERFIESRCWEGVYGPNGGPHKEELA